MAYSYDGFTWVGVGTLSTSIFGLDYDAVEPDVNVYMYQPTVAVGSGGNIIAYSADGMTWQSATTPTLTEGRCVAYNGTYWIAGGSGTHTLATSTDGKTWSPVTTSKTIFSIEALAIAWNGTLWVAGGSGTNALAYSYDGQSWRPVTSSPFTSTVYTVTWNGTMFMAGGIDNPVGGGRGRH